MTSSLSEQLFDPDFLNRLQQFSLKLSQAQKGGRLAEQKTSAKGQGLEFADFKPYVAGDDLRAIDWNLYQRLGRLFVRVFEEQQDMPVYFLLDLSNSMFAETPPRIFAALKTTLALSAIALGQHDSVSLFPFSGQMNMQLKALSGKNNIMRLAGHLAEYQAQEHTALAESVQQLASLKLRQGLAVIVSDFFDPAGIDVVISSIRQLRHKILLVQLTRNYDADPLLHPDMHGDIRLDDAESGHYTDLSITTELITRYKSIYQTFNQNLSEFAGSYGAGLIRLDAADDVLAQLTVLFESGGLTL